MFRNVTEDIKEMHERRWKEIADKYGKFMRGGDTLPECVIYANGSSIAGRANRHRCKYNLAYFIAHPKEFESQVVMHELCHAAARRIYDTESHGNLWRFIGWDVFGVELSKYHPWSRLKAPVVDTARIILEYYKEGPINVQE